MTIGITGPRRRAPWRGAVVALIVAAIVGLICLILLGLVFPQGAALLSVMMLLQVVYLTTWE